MQIWCLVLACMVCIASSAAIAEPPIVGAIRWDAWQDPTGVGKETDKTLSPKKWHYRVPFFGEIVSDDKVRIDGNQQAIMDQEIAYAAEAGLKYWAFVTYPDSFGMSNGLHRYLASTKKSQINFCLDLQGDWLSNDRVEWPEQVARYVGYFKDPAYQKVLNGRPLVYLFNSPSKKPRFPSDTETKVAFAQLRQASIAAGAGDPYIVFQGWHATNDAATIKTLGLDALSAYAVPAPAPDLPYSALMERAHEFWNSRKATGAQVVPIASAGWDNRTRFEIPTPWDKGGQNYYRPATAKELTAHVAEAITWVKQNPQASPANAVLIYAWNEHDEGGWLCPTLKPDGSADTTHLDAVAVAIVSTGGH